jgi:hypothetical protein
VIESHDTADDRRGRPAAAVLEQLIALAEQSPRQVEERRGARARSSAARLRCLRAGGHGDWDLERSRTVSAMKSVHAIAVVPLG